MPGPGGNVIEGSLEAFPRCRSYKMLPCKVVFSPLYEACRGVVVPGRVTTTRRR
jgi:hypothetical protein